MNMADGIVQKSADTDAATAGLLTTEMVRALAQAAGLPLAPGRESALLPILNAWLPDSAALNASMQGDDCRELLPLPRFIQETR